MSETVAILGAGAWGTALAAHLARASGAPAVKLWARDARQSSTMEGSRENARYLPGVKLPSGVSVLSDLGEAVDGASLVVLATPVGALVDLVEKLRSSIDAPLVWVGKGFVATADAAGVTLAHQRIAPLWRSQVGVISGPSFAEEVARGLPTAVSVAATGRTLAEDVARRLRGETFRAYVSDDLIGIEVGGAIKNVLAIAAGASDGLGFGNNARAALITRGLAETGRLSIALGGRRETLMGLAGLGDLVLTCTGDLSRNRRVGLALAAGKRLDAITAGLGHVAEGIAAAKAAHTLASSLEVEMPICAAVYRVLYENLSPRRAVEALLAREPGPEFQ
ncbi:MAG TPA: NAD(P)H-dependent glycerol-3-phosphate dehydrogenase [Casimicrobiaceae bacterium]|jgi:glycerol-3-phosphate dehydrogenase (NAD(P)+)|nr:NAD(P)H-dependent glycerol-3-phosphate dehydrogenase [Casimicrobiaceae bacterium]